MLATETNCWPNDPGCKHFRTFTVEALRGVQVAAFARLNDGEADSKVRARAVIQIEFIVQELVSRGRAPWLKEHATMAQEYARIVSLIQQTLADS